jgi:hypothetical protein
MNYPFKILKTKKISWLLVTELILTMVYGFLPISLIHAAPISTVRDAQSEVENAWEAYHKAALSGTLETPETQNQIEKDLDQARRLLVQARDMEKSNSKELAGILKQIDSLTQNIVSRSLRAKP